MEKSCFNCLWTAEEDPAIDNMVYCERHREVRPVGGEIEPPVCDDFYEVIDPESL